MKKSAPYLSLYFSLFFIIVLFSCKKKEGCTDSTATNYDAEAEKNCENCCVYNIITTAVESRDKFIGNFTVLDTLYNQNGMNNYSYKNYTMSITEYTGDTAKIIVTNLHNTGSSITATVAGNLFSVSSDSVFSGATTSGVFTLNGNKLTFDLDINYTAQNLDLYGTGTK